MTLIDGRHGDPENLVMRFGSALHSAGSAAHKIELGMTVAARRIGVEGQFFSTPTNLTASFSQGNQERTLMRRADPADINLERMSELTDLLDDLQQDRLDLATADKRIDEIEDRPARYSTAVTTLAFSLASGSAAVFLKGGVREVWVSCLVGLMIGLLAPIVARLPNATRLFEPLSAFVAAAMAGGIAHLVPIEPLVVTLAGLIVLLPGLTLTVAVTELATRHLVSGSARLAGALIAFFGLAFGVVAGSRLAIRLTGATPVIELVGLGRGAELLALLGAAAAFTVLFRARPRDYGWILLAGFLAAYGVRFGHHALGSELGPFIGALIVGVSGNIIARWRGRPAALIHIPGLILLVPGSLGFRSLTFLAAEDVLSGVQSAFETSFAAMALVMGMLMANMVLPPRGVL
ncbi:MAG: threonine/serine exporter family protein [Thermoanaerobaculia bacterium]|nr:threonine/serine exporter family protein [Thermoanaerobaculia bacterium]